MKSMKQKTKNKMPSPVIQRIDDEVQRIDDEVQRIDDEVQETDDEVQGTDNGNDEKSIHEKTIDEFAEKDSEDRKEDSKKGSDPQNKENFEKQSSNIKEQSPNIKEQSPNIKDHDSKVHDTKVHDTKDQDTKVEDSKKKKKWKEGDPNPFWTDNLEICVPIESIEITISLPINGNHLHGIYWIVLAAIMWYIEDTWFYTMLGTCIAFCYFPYFEDLPKEEVERRYRIATKAAALEKRQAELQTHIAAKEGFKKAMGISTTEKGTAKDESEAMGDGNEDKKESKAMGDGKRKEKSKVMGDGNRKEKSEAMGDGNRKEKSEAMGDGNRKEKPEAMGDGNRKEKSEAIGDGNRDTKNEETMKKKNSGKGKKGNKINGTDIDATIEKEGTTRQRKILEVDLELD